MKFKVGINPFGASPELTLGLMVCDTAYIDSGYSLTVTSINDGKHSEASLHYSGNAADLRIWGVSDALGLVERIKDYLGNSPDYDVVLESDHIHIEYQPKCRALR